MAFMISMPATFKVGDTLSCRINGKPAQVTWRDQNTLVIEPDDARRIVRHSHSDDDLQHFDCADADGTTPFITYPVNDLMADSAEMKFLINILRPLLSEAEKRGLRYPLEAELNAADGGHLSLVIKAYGEPPVVMTERSLLGISEDCYPIATQTREWDIATGQSKGRTVHGKIVAFGDSQK